VLLHDALLILLFDDTLDFLLRLSGRHATDCALSHRQLVDLKFVAADLLLTFQTAMAQVVDCIHCLEEGKAILDFEFNEIAHQPERIVFADAGQHLLVFSELFVGFTKIDQLVLLSL
jgi:hypothetical protein